MLDKATIKNPDTLRHSVLDFRQMSAFVENPLIFERGEGVFVWDIDGNRYYDGLSGVFVVAVGHQNQRVIGAIKEQMDRISFSPPLHGTNRHAVELAALLAELAPGDLNAVKLLSSGSEATEIAMKAARQFWKQSGKPTKYKFISRYYGYHGSTLGAMSATGTPSRRAPFEPLAAGYVHVPTVHCYHCPYQKTYPECGVFCAEYLRQVIELEGADTVAAVIVEPIGNTGGILVPPDEYLPKLRQICDDYDVLLIFDEMICGMGRSGDMFSALTFGVTPDMLCLGKGLSSGYAPLAATIWSDRIQQAFWGPEEDGVEFGDGHTFSGNPIASVAGLASIREILERDLVANGRAVGQVLASRLHAMADTFGIFGEIRGKGLLWGVELAQNLETHEPFPAALKLGKRIGAEAQKRGLIMRHDPGWFALAPPLISTESDIHAMCDILEDAIATVLEEIR